MLAQRFTLVLVLQVGLASVSSREHTDAQEASVTERAATGVPALSDERKTAFRFLEQELIPARRGTWVFRVGETPRIVWRDVEAVRRLGFRGSLVVRWFDAGLRESPVPDRPGRWIAWIEGMAPNGTPLRRALTFFALPEAIETGGYLPDFTAVFPNFPGAHAPQVVREHAEEIARAGSEIVPQTLLDSERGAILAAGLFEFEPLGRPARFLESAAVRHDDAHLALKIRLQGGSSRAGDLAPPRRRKEPALALHLGTPSEAGMRPNAKQRIDAVCRAWAADSGEPFVTLVARNGVIVTHEAFGLDRSGQPASKNYRCWVASITKTVTALMFSRLIDQGFVGLDDSLSEVFPDYPPNDPHVPTFRQCLNHTSGLSGHDQFGGMRNPHLENFVLNAIHVNSPGTHYEYCGLGFELTAKAMELLTRKSFVRLYHEQLFQPLGMADIPLGNASSDCAFTAMELGKLAQLAANHGSYGSWQFIRSNVFEQLLPRPVDIPTDETREEGIGFHWVRHRKPGTTPGSTRPEDFLFSPRAIGHGSFSGCIFFVDPAQRLVVTQVRRQAGPRHGEWSAEFFRTIAAVIAP